VPQNIIKSTMHQRHGIYLLPPPLTARKLFTRNVKDILSIRRFDLVSNVEVARRTDLPACEYGWFGGWPKGALSYYYSPRAPVSG